MARNFLNKSKWIKVKDHTAAGTSDVTSDIVDTAGFQGVVFVTSFSTANATNAIKIQQNTANQTTGMADLADTAVSSGTTDEDVIVEIHKPGERYVQAVVSRGASTTCESIWAVLYGGESSVATNTTPGTQIAELHITPAEGTA
jgi:hypothetical protein